MKLILMAQGSRERAAVAVRRLESSVPRTPEPRTPRGSRPQVAVNMSCAPSPEPTVVAAEAPLARPTLTQCASEPRTSGSRPRAANSTAPGVERRSFEPGGAKVVVSPTNPRRPPPSPEPSWSEPRVGDGSRCQRYLLRTTPTLRLPNLTPWLPSPEPPGSRPVARWWVKSGGAAPHWVPSGAIPQSSQRERSRTTLSSGRGAPTT